LYSGGTINAGFVKIVNSSGGSLFVPKTSANSLPQLDKKEILKKIKIKPKNLINIIYPLFFYKRVSSKIN